MIGWHSGTSLGGSLGAHDAGHPGDGKHVAFFVFTVADHRQSVGIHTDPTFGHGAALAHLLAADIDHLRLTPVVEVGQFILRGHGIIRVTEWVSCWYCSMRA